MSAIIRQDCEEFIEGSAVAAGLLGVPGVFFPPADVIGMAGIWTTLFIDISDKYSHNINEEYGKKFIASLLKSASLYYGGSKLLTFALSYIPFAGTDTGPVSNAVLNYWFTKRFGKMVAKEMSSPEFNWSGLERTLLSATALIFAVPTADEVEIATSLFDGSLPLEHPEAFRIFEEI